MNSENIQTAPTSLWN